MNLDYCDFIAGCFGGDYCCYLLYEHIKLKLRFYDRFYWIKISILYGSVCFVGACGVLIGHPLNTIKTWQQATNSRIGTSMYEIIVRNNGVGHVLKNGKQQGSTPWV